MRCPRGHSFDLAKQGYVSLLTGSSTKMTGDTPEMLDARAAFQAAGHFAPIAAAVARAVGSAVAPMPTPSTHPPHADEADGGDLGPAPTTGTRHTTPDPAPHMAGSRVARKFAPAATPAPTSREAEGTTDASPSAPAAEAVRPEATDGGAPAAGLPRPGASSTTTGLPRGSAAGVGGNSNGPARPGAVRAASAARLAAILLPGAVRDRTERVGFASETITATCDDDRSSMASDPKVNAAVHAGAEVSPANDHADEDGATARSHQGENPPLTTDRAGDNQPL
ncbi:hypothetical protein NMK54_24100, partial [Nocardia otitidiscaviarum]|nr:hypothetical protein [Nocardia otitidiscaviarum]